MGKLEAVEKKIEQKQKKKADLLTKREHINLEISKIDQDIRTLDLERYQALCDENGISYQELKELLAGGNSHV